MRQRYILRHFFCGIFILAVAAAGVPIVAASVRSRFKLRLPTIRLAFSFSVNEANRMVR